MKSDTHHEQYSDGDSRHMSRRVCCRSCKRATAWYNPDLQGHDQSTSSNDEPDDEGHDATDDSDDRRDVPGELTPDQNKKMSERMAAMANVMRRMSGLGARPHMREGDWQKQMDQMRRQMDAMKPHYE
jgi:hypothetical protein